MDSQDGWNKTARYFLWLGFIMIITQFGLVLTALFAQTDRLSSSPTADELIVTYLGIFMRFSTAFWVISWIGCSLLVLGGLIKLFKGR